MPVLSLHLQMNRWLETSKCYNTASGKWFIVLKRLSLFHISDTESGQLKRPRPISPVEITEEDYRKMLLKHHRRILVAEDEDDEDHPEYNTQNITLQDVMARCQASRKGGQSLDEGVF